MNPTYLAQPLTRGFIADANKQKMTKPTSFVSHATRCSKPRGPTTEPTTPPDPGEHAMKYRTLLSIYSAIAVVMGLGCVLIPDQLISNYGVELEPMGSVIYQFWGATLIGLGMLTWATRTIEHAGLQRAIAFSLLITNGLSVVIAVRGQDAGANALGWSTVTLFAFLTAGFAWLVVLRYRDEQGSLGGSRDTGHANQ